MTLGVDDVVVSFDDERVLEGVSLDVAPGEVVSVVGPSGTGKTTLLRLFALFSPPDAGRVRWDGEDVWTFDDERRLDCRRQVAMAFQEPSLFNAPVAANLTYGLRVRQSWTERLLAGLRRLGRTPSLPPAAAKALDTVGLGDKHDQNALSLSGGEAQRVAFARALATDPRYLLLDEPTSNLDPRNTAILEEAIRRARDDGVGVLVATHDMHQAKRISDRVGFVLEGTLVEVGPPEQVFENPTDPRTTQFVDGELVYESDTGEASDGQNRTTGASATLN